MEEIIKNMVIYTDIITIMLSTFKNIFDLFKNNTIQNPK